MKPDAALEHFVASFAANEAVLAESSPAWLAPLRRDAIEKFASLGFPTRKNEAWKYTNVGAIAKAAFDPSPTANGAVSSGDVRALLADRAQECTLVFIDGRFDRELSTPAAQSSGLVVGSLSDALAERPTELRPLLEASDSLQRPFTALNGAFQRDGAYVRVTRGVQWEQPIQLIFVATPEAAGRIANPRNLISIDAGASAAVMLHYTSLCDASYATNAVTQVRVGVDAELDLVTIQSESDSAYHLSSVDVVLDRDSRFRSHWVSLGGALARNEVHARLDAPGIDCALNGLFVAGGEQHVDSQTTIDHASPHGTSRELYKGILDGRSRGVFNGAILVRPGAQKTSAQQSNPNLLTSNAAHIDTKPTLEIRANDVKCSHGATIGRLDDDSLFYLRSRGVDLQRARKMLTVAFASEIAQGIPQESFRTQVEKLVAEKLERNEAQPEAA
jgi:Fe-S cluster assembly protein SufD